MVSGCAGSVVFVANRGFALQNSRRLLIQHLLDRGFNVVLITADDKYARALVSIGCELEVVRFNRGGLSIVSDIISFIQLIKLYRLHKPVLVHQFHAKPVILGGIAARMALGAKGQVVSTITGLGHAFISGGLIRELASIGYRISLPLSSRVVFQNTDDLRLFESKNWVRKNKARLIVSSGVDCQRYINASKNETLPINTQVLLVGRLLWQKGIGEFVEAARTLKDKFPNVDFLIAGEEDYVHPDSVPKEYIEKAVDEGVIKYLGFVDDIENKLALASLFVLPSYREGVPRVVLEAAAAGVPSVGADVPGTREVIIHGKTGLLVPVKDVASLVSAIEQLLDNEVLRKEMGKQARENVWQEFDFSIVTEKHIALYRELGVPC